MWDMISTIFKVLLGVVAVFSIGRFLYCDVIPQFKNGAMQSDVIKNGLAVNADIISSSQTSYWGGNKPIYKLTFRFKTMDNVEVESSLTKALSFEEIERFSPGNGTTIKYDPKNPKRIALFDKPLILGDN
ncbi:DUF3592 domain-containing protein [Serratia rhizosphaerae]|nr:DUF3592 domain-containing protein [Serratia rubidaea]